ncbi:MAG: hypothetical protein QOI63_623 [Thermoplasmata archaeon]|nr:hypothetical protein [Thermoplasmata archaeon]
MVTCMRALPLLAAAVAGLALSGCLQGIPGVGGVIVTDHFVVPAHGYLIATPDGFKVPEASRLGWSLASDGSSAEACLMQASDAGAYVAGGQVACAIHPSIDYNGSLSDAWQAKAGTYTMGLHCLADHDCPLDLYMGYATERFIQEQSGHAQKMAITLPYAQQLTLPNGVRFAQTFTHVGGTHPYDVARDGGNTQWVLFPAAQVDDFMAGKTPSPVYAFSDVAKGATSGSLELGAGQYAAGLFCKEQAPCTFTERLSEPTA